jgi:hypothetical protein
LQHNYSFGAEHGVSRDGNTVRKAAEQRVHWSEEKSSPAGGQHHFAAPKTS